MEDKDAKKTAAEDEKKKESGAPSSDEWATEALADMSDFIESQGIYIRQ
ncbi:MAG: hypothetical protein LUI02_01010 [Clostridiales bacterium]|nr:hypothetical protein [Clostridiales bacterium]